MKTVTPIYGQDYAPGFVGFTRRNDGSFLSDGIVWFQSLDEACTFIASHTFIVVDEKVGIESAEKGVEFFDLQARIHAPELDVVFREPKALDDAAIGQILTAGITLEKKEVPYDYTGLLGGALRILLPLDKFFPFLRRLPVPLHVMGMYCSAFCAWCLKAARKYQNAMIFRQYHITRISPVILWNRFPFKPLRFDKERGEIPGTPPKDGKRPEFPLHPSPFTIHGAAQ